MSFNFSEKWKLKNKLKRIDCQWKDSPVRICVRAAADSGAGCTLHKSIPLGVEWGLLNIRDIKDLHIYYDSIPADGSILKKGI